VRASRASRLPAAGSLPSAASRRASRASWRASASVRGGNVPRVARRSRGPTRWRTHAERRPFGVTRMQKPVRSSSKSSTRPDWGGRIESTVRAVSLTVDMGDPATESVIESL
jgi:hypothetical protein